MAKTKKEEKKSRTRFIVGTALTGLCGILIYKNHKLSKQNAYLRQNNANLSCKARVSQHKMETALYNLGKKDEELDVLRDILNKKTTI